MAMMPDFTFEVKPVVVRKEHTKSNDFADHYLAHGIKVTAAFGKIGDASGMSFLTAMPHRIQMNAQSGFRSPIIHEPRASYQKLIRVYLCNPWPILTRNASGMIWNVAGSLPGSSPSISSAISARVSACH